jgi:hypothetical protein
MSQPAPELIQPYPERPPQYPAQNPAQKPPVGGVAIAALVVGIIAFLLGWVVGLGFLLGVAGIILGILAMRTKPGKTFGVIGLILSGIATLTNIVATFLFVMLLGGSFSLFSSEFASGFDSEFGSGFSQESTGVAFQQVDTPCYSFDGPAHYINNLSASDVELCSSRLELWGDVTAEGEVRSTGVGAVFGSVAVEPIRVETSDAMAPSDTIDEMVQAMSLEYLPSLGTVDSLIEPITLDGTDANLTRLDSDAEFTDLKAVITARAPADFQTANGPVRYFVLSVVIPDEVGQTSADEDQILAELIRTWAWK